MVRGTDPARIFTRQGLAHGLPVPARAYRTRKLAGRSKGGRGMVRPLATRPRYGYFQRGHVSGLGARPADGGVPHAEVRLESLVPVHWRTRARVASVLVVAVPAAAPESLAAQRRIRRAQERGAPARRDAA